MSQQPHQTDNQDSVGASSSDAVDELRHSSDTDHAHDDEATGIYESERMGDDSSELGNTIVYARSADSSSESASSLSSLHSKADFGEYSIEREIARGGMGVVFKARQTRLNRPVALKVIVAGEFADHDSVQRFQAEAEAAASLQHSGIVPIYEVGECEGQHFFSMGFVDGATLATAIVEGPLDGRVAATLLAKIADAVAYAHEHGIVHRDLKPGNVLLDRDGEPHITDFGLAKRTDSDSHLTSTGQIVGTPSYMAPEQASGRNDLVGPLSDVYSLGSILYFVLTARPPFHAASRMETCLQVINRDCVSPRQLNSAVDRDLETICLKCLQKEPSARYQSAALLKADLQRYLDQKPIHARPISLASRALRWCKRNPTVSILTACLALIVLLLATLGPVVAVTQTRLRGEADRLVTEKEDLIDELNSSINETEAARERVQESANALNRHLVEMYVERGNKEISAGDSVAALPWYGAALGMDAGDKDREWAHRVRLASVLSQAPRPQWIWQLDAEVYSAAVSSDGRLVAAGGRDGQVVVWNTETGRAVFSPERFHSNNVTALRFSPDDRLLVASISSRVQVWDLTEQQPAIPLMRFDDLITDIDFDPAGKFFVLSSRDGKLYVNSLLTGKTDRTFPSHDHRVTRVLMNASGNRLFSVDLGGTARLWDFQSGEVIREVSHQAAIVWAEFDPKGRRVLTASEDRTVEILDAATGEPDAWTLVHPDRVRVACFNATGTKIATGCYDTTARIWDAHTGALLAGPMDHENSVLRVDFSDDGKYLVTASLDHTARLWDASSGKEVSPPLHHGFMVKVAQFLPDNKRVMTASGDRMVRIWKFQVAGNLETEVEHGSAASVCRFSPDGKLLLTAGDDGSAKLWKSDTGKPTGISFAHDDEVRSVDFSPDGTLVATASSDGTACVWSVETGETVTPQLQHQREVFHVEFSPDGGLLLTSAYGAATLWEAQTGKLVHELPHRSNVRFATFDSSGSKVLTCSDDRTAAVWDVRSGERISPQLKHAYSVEGGAFSTDGKTVVTASRDHTAQMWDITSGDKVTRPMTHFAGVVYAYFTHDGQRIVTGARDGTARIWNVQDGSPATPPLAIGRGLIRVALSPCGRYIATGGFAPTAGGEAARIWDARTGRSLGAQIRHDHWVNDLQFSGDSTKLVTACEDGAVRVWKVPVADERPVETLQRLAHTISGHRADPKGGLVPLTSHEMQALLSEAAAGDDR